MNKIFNLIHRHRFDILFSVILVLLVLFIVVLLPKDETKNIVNILENKTFDIRQNIIAKDKHARKDIVIITVDDPSYEYLIDTYGDWPIPRNVYANILDYVQKEKPKYVAFDLLFIKSLKRVPGSDDKLIEAFKKYQNTYTALNFDDYDYELRKPPVIQDKIKSNIEFDSKKITPHKYSNCRKILDEIIEATNNVGHINTPKADDGFTRTIPAFISYPLLDENYKPVKDEYYLYMTLKMLINYLNTYEGENITKLVIDKNNNLILGSRKVPLTKRGDIILNWYGKSGTEVHDTFQYVSFWEVLKSIEAQKHGSHSILPKDFFKDKIVFIGTNVFALSDIKTVPTSKYLPGVEIHATLFNNILDNNVIKKVNAPINYTLALLLSILSAIFVIRIRSVYVSVILFISSIGLYLYLTTFIMSKFSLWIWNVVPIMFALLVFVGAFLVKYLFKSRDFEYTYKLATTDGLTELYNHRFFQEQMKNKIDFAKKQDKKFSLILIDIDFFKKFNDKYGHQAGDAVLKHVARTLKSCVRAEDMVCRYGGEEMTIILNNADRNTGVGIAQKICKTIADKDYELTPDLEVKITISLGVSTYPENGTTPTELIEYADKCLYKAKENGRNQVGFLE